MFWICPNLCALRCNFNIYNLFNEDDIIKKYSKKFPRYFNSPIDLQNLQNFQSTLPVA